MPGHGSKKNACSAISGLLSAPWRISSSVRGFTRRAEVFLQPGFTFDKFLWNLVRHPAVSFAQQSYEIWTAAVDLLKVDGDHATIDRLFLGDAPARVHHVTSDVTRFTAMLEFRKDKLLQLVPLSMHITKGGRNKDADGAIGQRWRYRLVGRRLDFFGLDTRRPLTHSPFVQDESLRCGRMGEVLSQCSHIPLCRNSFWIGKQGGE